MLATRELVLQCLPCQAPDVIGSALRLTGPVSFYCGAMEAVSSQAIECSAGVRGC